MREPSAHGCTGRSGRRMPHSLAGKDRPRRAAIASATDWRGRCWRSCPLAVAVINADATLSFWNEQAGLLFGAPPLMAAERPTLAEMLRADRHPDPTAARPDRRLRRRPYRRGDRTEPDGCLRLSLGRALAHRDPDPWARRRPLDAGFRRRQGDRGRQPGGARVGRCLARLPDRPQQPPPLQRHAARGAGPRHSRDAPGRSC